MKKSIFLKIVVLSLFFVTLSSSKDCNPPPPGSDGYGIIYRSLKLFKVSDDDINKEYEGAASKITFNNKEISFGGILLGLYLIAIKATIPNFTFKSVLPNSNAEYKHVLDDFKLRTHILSTNGVGIEPSEFYYTKGQNDIILDEENGENVDVSVSEEQCGNGNTCDVYIQFYQPDLDKVYREEYIGSFKIEKNGNVTIL